MRITAEAKHETRRRILAAAASLFAARGFDATTTRDLAQGAGIAAGTLFNYFPSKEHVAVALVNRCLAGASDEMAESAAANAAAAPLEERLFALVAGQLRRLRGCRSLVRPVLELALHPDFEAAANGESLRAAQLNRVGTALAEAPGGAPPDAVALQLFWTLYVGVLSAWAVDTSPHQEETLALLDQSTRMFAAWYTSRRERASGGPDSPNGAP